MRAIILISFLALKLSCAKAELVQTRFSDLPFNDQDRLLGNWVMFLPSSSSLCHDSVFEDRSNWIYVEEDAFSVARLTEYDANVIVENGLGLAGKVQPLTSDECLAVRLIHGSPRDLLHYPLPENTFRGFSEKTIDDLSNWLYSLSDTETGWVSYVDLPLKIFWIDDSFNPPRRVESATLLNGDKNTVWLQTRLGHKFEVEDTSTGRIVFSNKVQFDSYNVVGDMVYPDVPSQFRSTLKSRIKDALSVELERSQAVKRTFTPTGFDVGELPKDIFSSMLTYYYNSYNHTFVEEWADMVHVNWWETEALMVVPPWKLKRYWQSRLLPMVEEWIGGQVALELTDIYGIRRYKDGARLLTHVDRQETHAVSVIINLEQIGMRKDWFVEIYDFNGNLHMIPMVPGQIVYYESARCLHGRMTPLAGTSYSNIFSHYRPVGNPKWYLEENPIESATLSELESCSKENSCEGKVHKALPFLVSDEEPITKTDDLFKFWEKVGK